jgi:hypothetical protein
MGFSEHALNRGLGEALGSGREADLEIGPPGHCLFAVFYLHRQLIRTRITFFLARGRVCYSMNGLRVARG